MMVVGARNVASFHSRYLKPFITDTDPIPKPLVSAPIQMPLFHINKLNFFLILVQS